MKFFVKHASHWVSPKNVALSAHVQVPPYSVEAVKTGCMPQQVDIEARKANKSSNLLNAFSLSLAKQHRAFCITRFHCNFGRRLKTTTGQLNAELASRKDCLAKDMRQSETKEGY